jgi:hypothetical protein
MGADLPVEKEASQHLGNMVRGVTTWMVHMIVGLPQRNQYLVHAILEVDCCRVAGVLNKYASVVVCIGRNRPRCKRW